MKVYSKAEAQKNFPGVLQLARTGEKIAIKNKNGKLMYIHVVLADLDSEDEKVSTRNNKTTSRSNDAFLELQKELEEFNEQPPGEKSDVSVNHDYYLYQEEMDIVERQTRAAFRLKEDLEKKYPHKDKGDTKMHVPQKKDSPFLRSIEEMDRIKEGYETDIDVIYNPDRYIYTLP